MACSREFGALWTAESNVGAFLVAKGRGAVDASRDGSISGSHRQPPQPSRDARNDGGRRRRRVPRHRRRRRERRCHGARLPRPGQAGRAIHVPGWIRPVRVGGACRPRRVLPPLRPDGHERGYMQPPHRHGPRNHRQVPMHPVRTAVDRGHREQSTFTRRDWTRARGRRRNRRHRVLHPQSHPQDRRGVRPAHAPTLRIRAVLHQRVPRAHVPPKLAAILRRDRLRSDLQRLGAGRHRGRTAGGRHGR